MTEELEVRLCPRRMQECYLVEGECPLGPVQMGDDPSEVVAMGAECEHAGLELPPYYYRALGSEERKRYRGALARFAMAPGPREERDAVLVGGY